MPKPLLHMGVSLQVFPLCEALATDTNAVVLDLSFNKLNDLAAQAIAGLIKVLKGHHIKRDACTRGRSNPLQTVGVFLQLSLHWTDACICGQTDNRHLSPMW